MKKSARYTCPRCNVRYCSLECYRSEKHGGCSEAFYHDCVVEDLADTAVRSEIVYLYSSSIRLCQIIIIIQAFRKRQDG